MMVRMNTETERLILRPFEEKDAGDVLEYLGNPAVNCFAWHLYIGMVNEMFIENQNDDVADKAYHRVAGQAEFDNF